MRASRWNCASTIMVEQQTITQTGKHAPKKSSRQELKAIA